MTAGSKWENHSSAILTKSPLSINANPASANPSGVASCQSEGTAAFAASAPPEQTTMKSKAIQYPFHYRPLTSVSM